MERARAEARRRGTSLAALVRDAVDQLLARGDDAELREQAKRAVGGFHSGRHTTSVEHDDVLAQDGRW